ALDHHRRGIEMREHRIAHFGGGANRNHLSAGHRRQAYGTAHENHARPTIDSRLGDGIAHPPTRSIGKKAHGIQRFLGGPRGDEYGLAFEIARGRTQRALNRGDNIFHFGQSSGAQRAAGQKAIIGIDDGVPALSESSNIGLYRRMLPHIAVHGGRQNHRPAKCQIHRGKEIVRQPERELADDVRGGRRNEQKIVLTGHPDVLDCARQGRAGARGRKNVRDDLAPRQRRKGEGTDKLLGRSSENSLYLVAVSYQGARQLSGFIGRNSAAHAEDDSHRSGAGRFRSILLTSQRYVEGMRHWRSDQKAPSNASALWPSRGRPSFATAAPPATRSPAPHLPDSRKIKRHWRLAPAFLTIAPGPELLPEPRRLSESRISQVRAALLPWRSQWTSWMTSAARDGAHPVV